MPRTAPAAGVGRHVKNWKTLPAEICTLHTAPGVGVGVDLPSLAAQTWHGRLLQLRSLLIKATRDADAYWRHKLTRMGIAAIARRPVLHTFLMCLVLAVPSL